MQFLPLSQILAGLILACLVLPQGLATGSTCQPRTPAAVSTGADALEQVHLGLGHYNHTTNTWSMTVSWAQTSSVPGSYAFPLVRLARSVEALSNCPTFFSGRTTSYTFQVWSHDESQFTTEANKNYASPVLSHTSVTGLEAATRYYYKVGLATRADGGGPFLERDTVFQFSTPAAPGTASRHPGAAANEAIMRMPVIGDIGQTEYSLHTSSSVLASLEGDAPPSLAIIVGDLSYADGGADRWDRFGRVMEPMLSRLPLATFPGNHEIEMDNRTHETFVSYRHRYIMPGVLPEVAAPATDVSYDNSRKYAISWRYDGGSSYYSFDVGLVHVVCLNTYDTYAEKTPGATNLQESFLRSDLASVDRDVTPFVVVMMHAPLYNSNAGHQGEFATLKMKEWAEPLLIQYKVDAVFAGHVHAYERNHGIINGAASHDGPMYITIGDGGNHELFYDDWLTQPAYSAYRDASYYGHGELQIFNRTHIRWVWIPNPAQDQALAARDSCWIAPRSARPEIEARPLSGGAVFAIVVCTVCVLVSCIGYFVAVRKDASCQENFSWCFGGREAGRGIVPQGIDADRDLLLRTGTKVDAKTV